MIIGLGGSKGSGKSTVASALVDNDSNVGIASFGYQLKVMLSKVFELPTDYFTNETLKEKDLFNIDLDQTNVRKLLDYANSQLLSINNYQYSSGLGFTSHGITSPRRLMQVVASDLFRDKVDNHYWVKAFNLITLPRVKMDYSSVVIDDVRFQNEVDYVKGLGGSIIFINRENTLKDLHYSERVDIVKLSADLVVLNNNIDQTINLIKEFIK